VTLTALSQERQETVTAQKETAVAIVGEVVNTDEGSAAVKAAMLKENETIVKRNWKAATDKVGNVYKALTIIHTHDLWKLHKDDKGKRKYTAFDQYLFGEFGWTLSRVRALQIIKATRAEMIAAGELPESAGETRKRTAPEVTSEKAAKVTADQLQKVLDAFETRVNNIDAGDPDKAEVFIIFNDTADALHTAILNLRDLVARVEAEAAADASDAPTEDTVPTQAVLTEVVAQ
jgi:hypothetical protein